ncbi:hypothetical protein EMCRGX_G002563 [Ephydatia muelleri]
MKVRWDPAGPLLGMAAIVHPGHKSLSWLCASDRDKIIRQLRNEMCNVEEQQQENESIDTDVFGEEEDEMELPSKIPRISPATSTSDDDFNLLFGEKKSQQQDNTAQKKVDKELDKYMKEDETDFRKDDPLLWWKEREMLYPLVAKLAKKEKVEFIAFAFKITQANANKKMASKSVVIVTVNKCTYAIGSVFIMMISGVVTVIIIVILLLIIISWWIADLVVFVNNERTNGSGCPLTAVSL